MTTALQVHMTLENGTDTQNVTVELLEKVLSRQVTDAFVVLERIDNEEYAQTCWDVLNSYTVEYRDDSGHYQTKMTERSAVLAFFCAWARKEDWRGKHDWQKVTTYVN